jgi:hypothetical protein
MTRRAPLFAAALGVSTACAPAQQPRPEPQGAQTIPATPVSTTAASNGAAPVASAASSALPAAGSHRFVPDAPDVGFPTPALAGAATCSVTDYVLGPADDVVRRGESGYPVLLVFGTNGGLALWQHKGRRIVQPLNRKGAPVGPTVDGPQTEGNMSVTPAGAGFMFAFIKDKTVTFQQLSEKGALTASTGAVTLPHEPGSLLGMFSSADRTSLVIGELADPPSGAPPDLTSRLVIVEATFASGGRSRVATRTVYMPRPLSNDGQVFAGRSGDARAFLIEWPSGERALVGPDAVQRIGVEVEPLKTERLTWEYLSGEDTTRRFALSSLPRYPMLFGDKPPAASQTVRFTLTDKAWSGGTELHWTGERFAQSRLSGPRGKVDARLFSIDCTPK